MAQLAVSSEVDAQSLLVPVQEGGTLQGTGPFSRAGLTGMMCPGLLRNSARDCAVLPAHPGRAQPPATGRKHTVVLRRTQHFNPHCSKGRN